MPEHIAHLLLLGYGGHDGSPRWPAPTLYPVPALRVGMLSEPIRTGHKSDTLAPRPAWRRNVAWLSALRDAAWLSAWRRRRSARRWRSAPPGRAAPPRARRARPGRPGCRPRRPATRTPTS